MYTMFLDFHLNILELFARITCMKEKEIVIMNKFDCTGHVRQNMKFCMKIRHEHFKCNIFKNPL